MKPHLETYHCPWCGGLAFSSGPIQNGVFQEAVFCSRCGKPFSMLGRYEREPSEPNQQHADEGHVMYAQDDAGGILRYALKQVPAGKIVTSGDKTYRGGQWVSEKLIGQAVDAPAKAGKTAKKSDGETAKKTDAGEKSKAGSYHEMAKAKTSAKKATEREAALKKAHLLGNERSWDKAKADYLAAGGTEKQFMADMESLYGKLADVQTDHAKKTKAAEPEKAPIADILAPHAAIELSAKELTSVKRSLAALKRHHGDNVVKRIAELATAAHQAMQAATIEPAKAKLAKKLREYGEMMAAVRAESVKAGQLNEAVAELKPRKEVAKSPEPETPPPVAPVVADPSVSPAPAVPPASAFDDLLGQLRTENPGKAIAIRVGDFYEFHGDDAVRAATALHTDAKDRKNLVTGVTSPVLVIPHQAIDKMLTHLERAGVDVAVADLNAEMAGDAEPVVEPVPVAAPAAEPPVAPPAEPPSPPAKTDADHEQDYNAIRAQHNAEIARSHADWIATEKSFAARVRGVGKNTQKYAKINEEYLDAKQQSENARTAMNRKFYKELESHPFEAIRRQRDQDAMKAKREAEDRSRKERIAQRAAEAKAAIASAQGTTKMQVVDAWFPTFIANREKGGALASEPMSADEQEVFKANLLDSLSNLDKMIESKDVKLGGILHTRNPMFRDYFAAVTGIGLPKTEKGTTDALNAFIGQAKIDAIAAAKQAERQAKIDAAAKAKADARAALDTKYHGYTASMAPYMAATVDKNLSKPVRAEGVNYASIRDFVESKLQAGYRVDNGRFKQADGRYFDAAGIGASAINYAAYRSGQIQKAEAVAKEVAAPETAKTPPVSQPLPPPVAPIKPIAASTANRNDSFAQSVRDSVKLPPATPTPTFTWVDQQSAATDPAAQAARAATLKALRLNGFIANKYPFYRDGKSIRIGEGWVKTGPTDNWDSFTNEEAVAELNRITQEQAENFNRRGSPLRYAHGINN